ncbi:MAG: hypothetical protein ACK5Z5_06535 [Neisseriaceae bacterium]
MYNGTINTSNSNPRSILNQPLSKAENQYESSNKVNYFNLSTKVAAPTKASMQDDSKCEKYQENHIIKYVSNRTVDIKLKEDLNIFLSSSEFSSLCCEFYILACAFGGDSKEENLKLLINKFAEKAKNCFFYLDTTRSNNKALRNKIINTNKKLKSGTKRVIHTSEEPKHFPNYTLPKENLQAITNVMKDIFLNLSRNEENIDSVRLILSSPYLEQSLLDAEVGSLTYWIEALTYVVKRSSAENKKFDTVYNYLEDLSQNTLNTSLFKEIDSKMLNNLKNQYSLALKLKVVIYFKIYVVIACLMTFHMSYEMFFVKKYLDFSKFNFLHLHLITLSIIAISFYSMYSEVKLVTKIFDSTKLDIENYFKQTKGTKSITDLLKNYIIMPSIELEFIVERYPSSRPKSNFFTDREKDDRDYFLNTPEQKEKYKRIKSSEQGFKYYTELEFSKNKDNNNRSIQKNETGFKKVIFEANSIAETSAI